MSIERSMKSWIKRKERPEVPPSELEIAHIESLHRGGEDRPSNTIALTLIEHAFQHFQDGKYSSDWQTSQKDYGAVRLIVARMSNSERKVFNYLITHEHG